MLPPVSEFRYAQFCPIARACELLASRWTLLVVRDLFDAFQQKRRPVFAGS